MSFSTVAEICKNALDLTLGKDALGAPHNEIESAYQRLLSGNKLEHLAPVEFYDKPSSSGQGLQGLKERLWTLLKGWKKGDGYEDVEAHTSRLADREPPVGFVAYFGTGYYVAEKIFAKSGAFVTLWRNLSEPSRCLLVCRGTAGRKTATSGFMSVMNDFTKEIGFLGVRAIWSELASYLAEKKVEKLDIIGKSLGGGHAQYLTALILGLTKVKVEHVMTYCSVGAESVQDIYDQIIRETGVVEPAFTIYRNGGGIQQKSMDFVPHVGGKHLRSRSNTRVFYATPKGQQHYTGDGSLWQLVLSLGKPHTRQTSFAPYDLVESHDIDREVSLGLHLEPLRSKVAFLFHIASFGRLNPETLAHFYAAQKKISEKRA